MDIRDAWCAYQQLRYKYPTDDVRQWSTEDQQRADELTRIIYSAIGADDDQDFDD